MGLLDLFSVSGGISVPQSASSNASSGFTGGNVTVEGLRVGSGPADSTLLMIGLGALVVLYFVGRK